MKSNLIAINSLYRGDKNYSNRMAKQNKVSVLHLGCGNEKRLGAIGIDINPQSAADVIHDLNLFPYPFPANKFDTIIAEHVLEHLDNLIKVMEEIYRVAKPGAQLFITSSHFSSVDSFTDITHKHFLTSHSFDYLIPGTLLYKLNYSSVKFIKRNIWLGPKNVSNFILKIILKVVNSFTNFYEARFAFIFPVGVIYYDLEVDK